MAESNLEIKVTATGLESLGKMRKELRDLKKTRDDLVPGTIAFEKHSDIISKKQTAVNNAMRQGWSESAKMQNAYFRTGLALRELALNGTGLNSVLGLVGRNFGLVGIGITSAISAGVGIVSFFQKSSEEAKKAAEEISNLNEEWREFLLQSELLSGKEKGGLLATRVASAQDDIQLADTKIRDLKDRQKKIKDALSEGESGLMGVLGLSKVEVLRKKYELNQIEEQLNKIIDEREGLYLKLAKAQKELSEQEKLGTDKFKPPSILNTSPVGMPRMTLGGGRSRLFEGGGRGLASFKTSLISPLDEAQPKVSALTQTLASGATRFSRTLLDALIEGRNIAESIGYALLGFGLNLVTGGLGNIIMGKSFFGDVAPTLGGGGGPISISSQRVPSGAASMSQPRLLAKVQGTELLVMLDNSRAVLSGRTY